MKEVEKGRIREVQHKKKIRSKGEKRERWEESDNKGRM